MVVDLRETLIMADRKLCFPLPDTLTQYQVKPKNREELENLYASYFYFMPEPWFLWAASFFTPIYKELQIETENTLNPAMSPK